ncbi:MAG: hypothetical protein LBL44_02065, partial [Treponema sp.]|nr:hypothetical protein [Treponema sp.]
VKTSEAAKTITVPLFGNNGFINAVIDFTVDSKNFTAGLTSETAVFSPETLPLAGVASGTVKLRESFQLGGPAPGKTEEAGEQSGESPNAVSAGSALSPEQGTADTGAVIDEFAVFFIRPAKAASESLGPS